MDADTLIIDLIQTDRQASEQEIAQIVTRVARAPFATREIRPPRWLREQLAEQDVTLSKRMPADQVHLLKRIHFDQQWPEDTTIEEFVADLQHAVQHDQMRMWTYEYFGDPFAGFLAPSHVTDPPGAKPHIFVAYGATYGTIVTGYQATGPETIFTDKHERVTQHTRTGTT